MTGSIIVMVGISGSGKSTLTEKMLRGNETTYVRVNRDKIREQLFGYTESNVHKYYERPDWLDLEKFVSKVEDSTIKSMLSVGKIVIMDNTHLKLKYIKKYFDFGVPVDVKFIDVDYETAVDRDAARVRKVGEPVIKKQYNQYKQLKKTFDSWYNDEFLKKAFSTIINDTNKPSCVIFDIDGTLANLGTRHPYDWDNVGEDTVNEPIREALWAHRDAGKKIIVATGRDGICEDETRKWLLNNGISFDRFYIKGVNDMRKDFIVKQEMWNDITKDFYIESMYDDRDQVVQHARMLGFTVFQCDDGNF